MKDRWSELARKAGRLWFAIEDIAVEAAGRVRARLGRRPAPSPEPGPETGPALIPDGRRVYAVGDIHGRADLLIRLLDRIEADAALGAYAGMPVLIFLGDYVDRGFQSRDVVDVLLSPRLARFETHFLKGNHESTLLDFLTNPAIGQRWADFGGIETLVSYGVRPPRSRTNPQEWERAAKELREKLPDAHRSFFESLKLCVRIGDFAFVHAGVRPGVALADQSEQDLLWIRDAFLRDGRREEAVIVHGHTPVGAPYRDHRRIAVDTGAYLSGRLTAVRLEAGEVEFIMTGAPQGAA